MNTKTILSILVLVAGLIVATSVQAQVALSQQGVKFPDGTVQTTAASPAGTITEYRIIGFTAEATDGAGVTVYGIVALDQMCANEFGVGARAAFSNERLAPGFHGSTAPAYSWILPTNVAIINLPRGGLTEDWVAYDTHTGNTGLRWDGPESIDDWINCHYFTENEVQAVGIIRYKSGAF